MQYSKIVCDLIPLLFLMLNVCVHYFLFVVVFILAIAYSMFQAIVADKIVKRCEKIRDTLDSCLSQIQNLVPVLLAAKVVVKYI